jgi:hypothetical protein
MVEAFMDAKYLHTIQVEQVKVGGQWYLVGSKDIPSGEIEKRVWIVVDAENVTPQQIAERRERLFNAALAFVERWDIKGQPEHMASRDDLVAQPYVAVTRLVGWFLKSIFDFCMAEREIPKVSSPESTDTLQTPATTEGRPN